MNLIVATRVDVQHLRLDVDGKWRYGDALNLAYLIKVSATRAGRDNLLVDLRRVFKLPDVQGRFLICDRLRRALAAPLRVALVSTAELIDQENADYIVGKGVSIAGFPAEGRALRWLCP